MRLFSLTAEYGLRALIWLGQRPDCPQTARQVAAGTGVPPHYLTKVLQALARTGLVSAHRGVGGGFRIGSNPREISILQVLRALDSAAAPRPLGGVHGAFARSIDDALTCTDLRIEAILAETNLEQLIKCHAHAPPSQAPGPEGRIFQ